MKLKLPNFDSYKMKDLTIMLNSSNRTKVHTPTVVVGKNIQKFQNILLGTFRPEYVDDLRVMFQVWTSYEINTVGDSRKDSI